MRYRISPLTILRVGLALVFASNALIAIVAPGEFEEIIATSFIGSWLPVSLSVLIPFIAINDAVLAGLLLRGKWLKPVAVWAGIWIAGVTVISGLSLDTLEEAGVLAMPAALYFLAARNQNPTAKRPD